MILLVNSTYFVRVLFKKYQIMKIMKIQFLFFRWDITNGSFSQFVTMRIPSTITIYIVCGLMRNLFDDFEMKDIKGSFANQSFALITVISAEQQRHFTQWIFNEWSNQMTFKLSKSSSIFSSAEVLEWYNFSPNISYNTWLYVPHISIQHKISLKHFFL